jgi:hypothetical protein
MKILIFVDAIESFTEKYLLNLTLNMPKDFTIEIFAPQKISSIENIFYVDSELEYYIKTGNYKAYDNFFNYISLNSFDKVIIPRLRFFEYFAVNLYNYENIHVDFTIGFFGLNEIIGSTTRIQMIKIIFSSFSRLSIICHSNNWYEDNNLELIQKAFGNSQVLRMISLTADPIYDDKSLYSINSFSAKSKLGLNPNKKHLLFFGNPNFGKGLDLLLNHLEDIPSNFEIVISSDLKKANYLLDHNVIKSRTHLIDRFVDEYESGLLFSASDIVCLPYRESYNNGTSGVLVQASLAGKPILTSKIEPFVSIIDRFKVGQFFDFEKESIPKSLENINLLSNEMSYSENWNLYLNKIPSWKDLSNLYLENK